MMQGLVANIVSMAVEQKNHHKHHALILFTFLVVSSLLLTELYVRFIYPFILMSLHTTIFLIFFCGVWIFLDNIVLGIDLIETKAKMEKAEKKIQILTNDLLLSDKKTEKNTTKWLSILTYFQQQHQHLQQSFHLLSKDNDSSSSTSNITSIGEVRPSTFSRDSIVSNEPNVNMIDKEMAVSPIASVSGSVVNHEKEVFSTHQERSTSNEILLSEALKEQLEICEKQKLILKKYLEQESTDHMETALLLDRTLELNSSLTKCLYDEKFNPATNPAFSPRLKPSPSSTISTSSYSSECSSRSASFVMSPLLKKEILSKKIERIHWQLMADKARTRYYIKRIQFFAECNNNIQLHKQKHFNSYSKSRTKNAKSIEEEGGLQEEELELNINKGGKISPKAFVKWHSFSVKRKPSA
jgi:hypothetical protein